MKIAIDFREGAKPTRAGKGEYVYQLVKTWIQQYPADQVILLVESGQRVDFNLGTSWRVKVIPAIGFWWQLWVFAWLEFARPVTVYFSATSLIIPAFVRSVKTVTTLADFTVWRFPSTHLPKAVWIERLCMPFAIWYSNHLLAISDFTRREAIELFHILPHKLTVTPLAVSAQFNSIPPSPEAVRIVRQKYHLPEKFLLYLGTLEPRKNIVRLISAFSSTQPESSDTHLVLAGAPGWLMGELNDPLPTNFITTGYIEDADRPLLYKLAIAFVFPSLYEGFGLPPLEAMTCGTPVIASVAASLPEVIGDAGVLVDPVDTNQLAQAIRRVLSSPELRAQLRQRGLVQAQKFSWDNTLALTRLAIHRYE